MSREAHPQDQCAQSQDQCAQSQDQCAQSQDQCAHPRDQCAQSQDQCAQSQDQCAQSQDQCAQSQDDRAEPLAEPLVQSLDRRTMLRAAGAGGVLAATGSVLVGCGGGSTPVTSGGSSSTNTLKVPAASVPVGSGVIVEGTLVVQPTAGTFLAFDGTCPHQGCAVNKIANGLALCPCHGSTFSVADGSVKHGPAQQGLAKRSATLTGDQVVIN